MALSWLSANGPLFAVIAMVLSVLCCFAFSILLKRVDAAQEESRAAFYAAEAQE